MTILLHPWLGEEGWLHALTAALPEETIRLCSDGEAKAWASGQGPLADVAADVEFVIAWRHPAPALAAYPNLQAILVTGAGVNQFVGPGFPAVPIIRLKDPTMAHEMAAYALHWIIRYQRGFDVTAAQQATRQWSPPRHGMASEFTIGVLGFGEIGSVIGRSAQALGYAVSAWSRTGGNDPTINHHAGLEELADFLAGADAIVNVLPSTDATRQILNADRFRQCRPDAILVNIGRGDTVSEPDLMAALDAGYLGRAVLDVTAVEPLPADSPLWSHPLVDITPHVAGMTQKRSAAEVIAANIRRLRAGQSPFPVFDPARGY